MKLLHISDLHLGKKVKGFSLIEDQKAILGQILDEVRLNKVNGVIIAGDIYDVSNPSGEAVSLFDKFISTLNNANVAIYAVSGNHDSIYRVSFASSVMAKENVHFAKKYQGEIQYKDVNDDVRIWLLPFIRPVDVREFHKEFEVGSYEMMMKTVLSNAKIDKTKINILVAHQFVTCQGTEPKRSESETVSLGTLDNIDVSNFKDFDYIALGHIHKPQSMGRKEAVYAGSPLKYSFSEKDDKKSMVLIEIENKKIDFRKIPYRPIRDMVEFRGSYQELISNKKCDDYARIILTDENFIPDVKHKLDATFSNIMEIVYDNAFTRKHNEIKSANLSKKTSPVELFKTFYKEQNNTPLTNSQEKIVRDIFENLNNEETK